jgi:hypothetical protein
MGSAYGVYRNYLKLVNLALKEEMLETNLALGSFLYDHNSSLSSLLYSLNNIDFVRINIKNEDPSNFLFGAFLFFGTCFLMLALAKHNAAIAFVNSKRPGSSEPVEGIINLKGTDFTKESTFYCVSTEQVQELEAKLKWYSDIVESKLYLKVAKTYIPQNSFINRRWTPFLKEHWSSFHKDVARFEQDSKRCIDNIKFLLSSDSKNSGIILSEDQKNELCSNITNLNRWLVGNQEIFENCQAMHNRIHFFKELNINLKADDQSLLAQEQSETLENCNDSEQIFQENPWPWLHGSLEERIRIISEMFK